MERTGEERDALREKTEDSPTLMFKSKGPGV